MFFIIFVLPFHYQANIKPNQKNSIYMARPVSFQQNVEASYINQAYKGGKPMYIVNS